ncbi:MAG: hypothetical protein H6930_15735 [Rhodoferax sp.]|nr:hypothetical protein [Rhodoferax sp.]
MRTVTGPPFCAELALAAGVSVIVRLAPLPPSAIPPGGSSVALLELALTVSAAVPPSSPMMNASGPSGVSSFVAWLPIGLIVGAALPALF